MTTIGTIHTELIFNHPIGRASGSGVVPKTASRHWTLKKLVSAVRRDGYTTMSPALEQGGLL